MAKAKTVFFCKECGYESSGWLGKCPGCAAWNSFAEEKIEPEPKRGSHSTAGIGPERGNEAVSVMHIQAGAADTRQSTGLSELDRVLGGGIVKGSLLLAAGDPGIGKSTLMLMLSGYIAASGSAVLYVSGEESDRQIKMRADRLHICAEQLYILPETSLRVIETQIERLKPAYVVVDSIQTIVDEAVTSAPGSVSQVREITGALMRIAKSAGISVFIVGHVTKEGAIAGPRVLEHMVDTVLYFEGERHLSYRILRCVKNRFGSTNEIGVFEMRDSGLTQVPNPSLALLAGRPEDVPGTAVVCTMEGTRPMLIEVQALICNSNLNMPRRMAAGLDYNRLTMLLAVLEKRAGFKMGVCDAYVNVIGGLRLTEPAADLAVAAAAMSSYKNRVFPPDTVFFGEVGLTGEIRAVNHIEKRLSEAFRLGFRCCAVPAGNQEAALQYMRKNGISEDCRLIAVQNVLDLGRIFKET